MNFGASPSVYTHFVRHAPRPITAYYKFRAIEFVKPGPHGAGWPGTLLGVGCVLDFAVQGLSGLFQTLSRADPAILCSGYHMTSWRTRCVFEHLHLISPHAFVRARVDSLVRT